MTNLKTKVFGTPTEAVADISNALPDDVINTAKNADVVGGATGKVDTISGADAVMGETRTIAKRVSPIDKVTETVDIDASNLLTKQDIASPKIDFTSDPTFIGEGISDTTLPTPPSITERIGTFAKDTATDIKDYVVEGDFVPDAALNIVGSELFGEEEKQSFAQGPVADQPLMEAAQGNYMRDVGPLAMAATGMTRMPSFQELSQQTLYGTGSPSWMAQFYQPLATPQGIG
tara:strand:- start:250 stop:945 length:696 start_codon:yes stop_codon:yes gene_type:complete